jgi:diguanylate cyclase (GGDEF)-like protein
MEPDGEETLFEAETHRWLTSLTMPVVWLDGKGQIGWLNPAAAACIPDPTPHGKRLETWFQPTDSETRLLEVIIAPWWQAMPSSGLVGMVGRRWRWFQATTTPHRGGQLCLLSEVTYQYNQALAYHSSLEVLSSLLTQEENLEALLGRVLEAAVEVVPGAEAGSLLLLEDGQFRFAAHIGFGEALQGHRLSLGHEQGWYGAGEANWLLGRPRLLGGGALRERARQLELGSLVSLGVPGEIQANICVPVVLQGQVMATLNLDSFSAADSFPPEALAIAQTFALQAATVLHGLLSRRSLSELALTDTLTKLGNRRALEEAYPKLQAQSARLELHSALIYWDMDKLKQLNDRLGHAAGDHALQALAAALGVTARRGDQAFRIGGDEFVSLHPGLEAAEVPELIERVRSDSGQRVSAGGVSITPELPLAEALRQADAAMYEDKHGGG